jgi:alcohol dehydrogenase class IV
MVSRAAGSERSFYHLIDGKAVETTDAPLPFIAVPTRCWNPLLFSEHAVLLDPRDRLPKVVDTGIYPDTVFFLTGLPDSLTEKQTLYDLLCIFCQCIESMHHYRGFAGAPLVVQPIEQAVSLLRSIPASDTPPDRAEIQTAGIHASWISPSPGTGFVVGRCAHAETGVAPEWVTAALLPAVAGYHLRRHPELIPELLPLLGIESSGNLEEDIETIENELRSLAGFADVPVRLRDLGIDSGSLADIAACASGMSVGEAEDLHDLLKTAL